MKKPGMAFAVLAIILMTCGGVYAQKLAPKSTTVTTAPDLTKLNIEKILQQMQTTNIQPNSQETQPLQVVDEFLQLQPTQLTNLHQFLNPPPTPLSPPFQTAH